MLGNLFATQKPEASVLVVARLNDRAQPILRGELYEDPLDAILRKKELGEVTGGGTQLGKDYEILFCDIEIQLHDSSEKTLDAVKFSLEELGAPKGSKLILESSEQEAPFGVNEGLAVYLNGTDLPDEVYRESDFNFVCQEFNRLLGSEGAIHGAWQGPTETALYVYGRSFEAMKNRLKSFLSSYPLCQKARVVQIA